eukprot:8681093-Pyramimonas_sp.AAC.1
MPGLREVPPLRQARVCVARSPPPRHAGRVATRLLPEFAPGRSADCSRGGFQRSPRQSLLPPPPHPFSSPPDPGSAELWPLA